MPLSFKPLRIASTALATLQLLSGLAGAQNFIDASFDVLYPGLTPECIYALNGTVACPSTLGGLETSNDSPSPDQVEALCVGECFGSLSTIRQNVESSCTAVSDLVEDEGELHHPTWIIDQFIHAFNMTCVRDRTTGRFCDLTMQTSFNTTSHNCSDCVLGAMNADLSSPVGYFEQGAEEFESMVSSCHASGYALSQPGTVVKALIAAPTTNSAQPAPSAPPGACATPYIIQEGDTCNSIAASKQVPTFGVVYTNNLDAYCSQLPEPGAKICLPESCNVHTVQKGESCQKIIDSNTKNATLAQLRAWNPTIDWMCSNLDRLEDTVICISPPGGLLNLDPKESTAPSSSGTGADKAVEAKCGKYHTVKEGESCASLSMRYGLSLKSLEASNEGLEGDSCRVGKAYCVESHHGEVSDI